MMLRIAILTFLVGFACGAVSDTKLANILYTAIDVNDDGLVTLREMTAYRKKYDRNGDDVVTKGEFTSTWVQTFGGDPGTPNAMYDVLDRNKDGQFTAVDVKMLHAQLDSDKNGELNDREFLLSLKQTLYQLPFITMFKRGDHDKDGFITLIELDIIFGQFDINSDGTISAEEFLTTWTSRGYSDMNTAKRLYDVFDLNHDDVLGRENDIVKIFKNMDYDGDSKLSETEFVSEWMNIMSQISRGPR
ncbi:uncharacterized protein LOC106156213 [Lingula anatina]|uniref:Uncharacterized protein LOC106156213 n=1 Tax=Lingula anatina TaxID=7574 RepID=A0A1S3HL90_LINAN|nr:uncharacterized protein LOC106156213 [Lingula anatina]|eukprot:XP_013386792.1 uncharacterized protein LOC106156213 [Lingula anatina]